MDIAKTRKSRAGPMLSDRTSKNGKLKKNGYKEDPRAFPFYLNAYVVQSSSRSKKRVGSE